MENSKDDLQKYETDFRVTFIINGKSVTLYAAPDKDKGKG